LSRDADRCACEIVEALGCPVADVEADGDRLLLTLHLPSAEPLSGVVDALESAGASVDLRYLVRDGEGPEGGDPVVVDRGRLTDRQREAVRTAYRMGYFEYPRSAGAGEVAAEMGITTSTFTEHLAAAQSKLLASVVADGEDTPREPRP